jgi:2'-5' RNA ligase
MTGSRRMFVAVRPPPEVASRLAGLVRPGRGDESPDDGIRWVTPSDYHVTLHFIGQADPEPVAGALDEVLPTAPAPVVLGPAVGELGSAVVVPAAGLDDLARLVADAVRSVAHPRARRPFVGHLTVGRRPRGRDVGSVVGRAVDVRFVAESVELLAGGRAEGGASRYDTIRTWSATGR